ncbi:Rieske 2Fe-2S domain-containing protein [Streptomyces sp. NPDC057702]|uniref:Rieske 2Fe-2S domain-containing protein n=1 Tax=unclassified Streptomyces TaxID=2593676 RepID=UPI0036758E3C
MSVWQRRERDPKPLADTATTLPEIPQRPYPDGWFALATSGEVRPGKVLTRRLMGQDVVLYRTTSGRLSAVRPFCPHLGAHLGHGGTVRGDNLVCPFHHFQFDPEGVCVRTGYDTPPPKARLSTLEFREIDDLVFVWHHAEGKAPQWEVESIMGAGFRTPRVSRFPLVAHPQDVAENFVDFGHFGTLHKVDMSATEHQEFDGHRLRFQYRVRPAGGRKGRTRYATLPAIRVTLEGVGNVRVEADAMKFGFELRARMSVTPLDPTHSDLRVSVALRPTGTGRRPVAGVVAALAPRVFAPAAARDVRRDGAIWAHSTHLARPRLAQGDGPIVPFRRWAQQFYSAPGDVAD